MFAYQLDMFEEVPTEIDMIRGEIKEVRERSDNLRRGLFTRHNIIVKEMNEQKDMINELRSEIKRLKLEIKNS